MKHIQKSPRQYNLVFRAASFIAVILFAISAISWAMPGMYSSGNFCLRQLSAKDRGALEKEDTPPSKEQEVRRLKTKLEQLYKQKGAVDAELGPLLIRYPSLTLTKPPKYDELRSEARALESAIGTIEARIQILEGRLWAPDWPSEDLAIAYDLGGLESMESVELIALLEEEFGVELDEEAALESLRGIVTVEEDLVPLEMGAIPREYQEGELHEKDVVLRLRRFMEEGRLSVNIRGLTGPGEEFYQKITPREREIIDAIHTDKGVRNFLAGMKLKAPGDRLSREDAVKLVSKRLRQVNPELKPWAAQEIAEAYVRQVAAVRAMASEPEEAAADLKIEEEVYNNLRARYGKFLAGAEGALRKFIKTKQYERISTEIDRRLEGLYAAHPAHEIRLLQLMLGKWLLNDARRPVEARQVLEKLGKDIGLPDFAFPMACRADYYSTMAGTYETMAGDTQEQARMQQLDIRQKIKLTASKAHNYRRAIMAARQHEVRLNEIERSTTAPAVRGQVQKIRQHIDSACQFYNQMMNMGVNIVLMELAELPAERLDAELFRNALVLGEAALSREGFRGLPRAPGTEESIITLYMKLGRASEPISPSLTGAFGKLFDKAWESFEPRRDGTREVFLPSIGPGARPQPGWAVDELDIEGNRRIIKCPFEYGDEAGIIERLLGPVAVLGTASSPPEGLNSI